MRHFVSSDDHLTDREIMGKQWIVGNQPTIADIACFPYVALSGDGGDFARRLSRCPALDIEGEADPRFCSNAGDSPQLGRFGSIYRAPDVFGVTGMSRSATP